MTNVIFNSGFIGFLIWVLLFAVSTAALQIAIRCVWVLHKTIFAMAEFKEKLIPFLFLCTALMVSLLPLHVQAALPKELPTAPAKFLTGACLTRSEDLWVTAEAGGVWNAPNRRLSVFGNSRRSFAADIGFRQRKNGDEIILPSREKLYKKEGKRLVISGKCCILYASVFGGSASTAAVPGSDRARGSLSFAAEL